MEAVLAEPVPEAEGEGEIDQRFEYDAPRYYDFDKGSPAGVQADGWFETDGPKGLTSPTRPENSDKEVAAQEQGGSTKAGQAGAARAVENHKPQHAEAEAAGKGAKGKGNGGSEWRRALASISNNKPAPNAVAQQAAGQHGGRKTWAVGTTEAADAAAAGPSRSRPVPASATRAAPAIATRPSSATTTRKQQAPPEAAGATTSQASSPRLHSRQRAHHAEHKTSEDLELEQVQQEKEEAAKLRRRNAEAVKHVLQPPAHLAVLSSKPLTQPVRLELCTSKRRRMHSMETRSMPLQNSPYKSTAEQIAAFEGRVPSKHHRLGEGGSSAAAADPADKHHASFGALTVPMSPQFATKQRVRAARFKPREEVEADEMAAMPKFKARPYNKRMMEDRSGQLGVPHVDPKPPTVQAPFAFKTDQRAAEHAPSSSSAGAGDEVFVFGAHGEGGRVTRSKGKKAAWTGQLTQPAPFHLATDARGANKRSAAADPHQEPHDPRPAKRSRKTAAGPFHLATDLRGAAEEARLEGMRKQQEEVARQEAEFKALPLNKAALAGAWKPAPHPAHTLTVPDEVVLHSDTRAAARRQFDSAVASKQAEMEAERIALQALQQQQEEEEVQEHRKKLGRKAQALPDGL